MKQLYSAVLKTLLVLIASIGISHAQVDFAISNLNFNGFSQINNGTSLMFGPDGRLYTSERYGTIKVYTVQKNAANDYDVIGVEIINLVQQIANHNDDGSDASNSNRQVTGLTVAGTAQDPVLYVTSSDPRVGGGGSKGDIDLDTNSGVITRIIWNNGTPEAVDLVRGLPRSEENHATNGLEYAVIGGKPYLIVCSGGFTNAGSPSNNFAFITEYALAAAVLAIDLDALDQLPILTDNSQNGRKYIYDLPTLDDPTRANANGIEDPDTAGYTGVDIDDPWGGNDGLNQAMLVPGSPVQIFSPGYRNTYDLVLTENGSIYVTDNGANGGWGGYPENEGPQGNVTNNFRPGEPGSTSADPVDGEAQVDNEDHLHLVTTDIQNYTFNSYYGGHPNPIRANPDGAGLYTYSTSGTFRTIPYDPSGGVGKTTDKNIALPANWPPVKTGANPVEGDYRNPTKPNPDGPDDTSIADWPNNANGIDEYTASNFGGAMKGDLIIGRNNDADLYRVQLKADGTVESLDLNFATNMGGNALGITCNGDNDPFPGTIWVATFNNQIRILEPNDSAEDCLAENDPNFDPEIDGDGDGYLNSDEIDNGTQVCSAASKPDDHDAASGGTLVSDLNDSDDDNDGIPDASDPLQLGDPLDSGSDAFSIPVYNTLNSDNPVLQGYLGLGFTGFMNNGDTGANWYAWTDRIDDVNDPNPNDILGGAIGAMTMQMTSGTARGSANTQEKGLQYGVIMDNTMGTITVEAMLKSFGQDLQVLHPDSPANGEVGVFIGDGTQSNFIQFVIKKSGLEAVQEIADSDDTTLSVPLSGTELPTGQDASLKLYFIIQTSTGNIELKYSINNGEILTLGTIAAKGTILNAIQNSGNILTVGLIGTSNQVGAEVEATWDYLNVINGEPINIDAFDFPLVRINAGGADVADPDNVLDWEGNAAEGSVTGNTYSVNTGKVTALTGMIRDASIPDYVSTAEFNGLFSFERWDQPAAPQMEFKIPLPNGVYLLRMYMGNNWDGSSEPGQRVFSYSAEGVVLEQALDLVARFGHKQAVALTYEVSVTDGELNVVFDHGSANNPLVDAIEILGEDPNATDPIVVSPVADQLYTEGVALDGSLSVQYTGGDGTAVSFKAQGLPDGVVIDPVSGVISGTPTVGESALSPFATTVTVSDATYSADVSFSITVEPDPTFPDYTVPLVRINAGGALVTDPDSVLNWEENATPGIQEGVTYTVNTGNISNTSNMQRHPSIPDYISPEEFTALFAQERWDPAAAPAMEYSIPIPDGTYLLRLYMGNNYGPTSDPGNRVFSFTAEGEVLESAMDLAVEFGHKQGGALSYEVTVSDGVLNLSFAHGAADNPLIDAIEVLGVDDGLGEPIVVEAIEDQIFTEGVPLDGSLTVVFNGGDGSATTVEATGLPAGLSVDSETGIISGIPDWGAADGSPYLVTVTVTDNTFSDTASFELIVEPWLVTPGEVLYRVNAGGPLTPAIDDPNPDWEQDQGIFGDGLNSTYLTAMSEGNSLYSISSNSAYTPLDFSHPSLIGIDVPTTVFETERYDGDSDPEMLWQFPVVPNTEVEVRLFFAELFDGVTAAGQRVFDVSVEGAVPAAFDGIDPYATAGPAGAFMVSYTLTVTDGTLDLEFIHDTENPALKGIEIVAASEANAPLTLADISDVVLIEGVPADDIVPEVQGGNGSAITFSADVLPAGLSIDPDTGIIGGTPEAGSTANSPYTVTLSATNDTETATVQFNIDVYEPLVLDPLADQIFTEGVQLDGSLFVNYSGGDGSNMSFEAEGLPTGLEIEPTVGVIGGTPAIGTALNSPYSVTVTVSDNTFTETVTFEVVILPGQAEDGTPVVRINAGPEVTDPNGVLDWEANNQEGEQIGNGYSVNTGINVTVQGAIVRTALIPEYITQAEFDAIFAQERYDQPAEPKMQFDIPLPEGEYTLNLYMADTYSQTTQPGDRLFNIYAEGEILEQSLDLVERFGDDQAVALTYGITVSDGVLEILFEHAGADNPIVSAIEVLAGAPTTQPLVLSSITDQTVTEGVALDGSLQAQVSGGDGTDVSFLATGLPLGVSIDENTGVISGTPAGGTANATPYQVQIEASDLTNQTSTAFFMTVDAPPVGGSVWVNIDEDLNYSGRHENSCVQVGDKFYLLGGREDPDIIDIWDYTTNTWENVPSNSLSEFNHYQATEYGGLIWVIGAFKTNSFPEEEPADFVWAFDPIEKKWIQGAEIPENRRRGSAGLVEYEGKFYVIGGNTIGHSGGYVNWFDMYDPATGEWTVLPDAPRARDHFHAAIINGKIYAVGGRLSGGDGGTFKPVIAEVDVYDFQTQQWTTLPAGSDLPTPRAAAVTVNFNEELYVIGGEVSNETVYGVSGITDALPITEIYNPQSGWRRGPDLNNKRHGTQGIVSGGGIFVFSGSPKLGGGNQQNMEALYTNTPSGAPVVASSLNVSPGLDIEMATGSTSTINLTASNGNVGIYISDITLAGSPEFSLDGGLSLLQDKFIGPGETLPVNVSLSQLGANQEAILTINYGLDGVESVRVFNGTVASGLVDPGTQFNNEGDAVNLPILFSPPGNENLVFDATNLPPVLTIDPNTGVISGTILEATDGGGSGSTYQPNANNQFLIQAEDGNPTGFDETNLGGAVGIIGNSNHFNNPTGGGSANYSINVTQPGVYRVNWRSFHSGPIGSEENDSWLKFENDANVWFFGIKGTTGTEQDIINNVTGPNPANANIVFPKGSGREGAGTTPEGSGGSGYFKVYKSSGGSETYFWQAFTSDNDPHNIYVYFVNPGTYTFTIGERSAGHAIDKIALYPVGQNPNLDGLADSSTGEGSGSPGALAGSPYNVTITVTDPGNSSNNDQVNFQWVIGDGTPQAPIADIALSDTSVELGQAISLSGAGSVDPDGSIVSYNWSLGDGGSDTQPSLNYTYTIPGTYTITLTVTDNDGNTGQSQETVTVVDPNAPVLGVSGFVLYNAVTDQPIATLSEGLQIPYSDVEGIPLNIVAVTNGQVGSVVMSLSGVLTLSATESFAPYALGGDLSGDFNPIEGFLPGAYGMSATAYQQSGGSGNTVGSTLNINFQIVEVALPGFTITATAGTGGTISPSGTVAVIQGGSQTFNISAEDGFEILDVLVGGQSVGAVESFTVENVTQDTTIDAVFSEIPTYTITATANTGGTISPEGFVNVNEGADQTFTFSAETGFEIADVLVNNQSVGTVTEYTFQNVTADATIELVVSEVPTFTITATAGAGGTIDPSGAVEVSQGGSQTFTISPEAGKVVDVILVDGQQVAITNAYTFSNVNADGTIQVSFADAPAPTVGVTGFALYNADTDAFIASLSEGLQIQQSEVNGIDLAIVALTAGNVGSVVLNLSGDKTQVQTESFAPYALFGDSAGDFTGEPFPTGNYVIGGTAFSAASGGGSAVGETLSISFQVVDVQLPSFTISATAGTGGSITPSGAVSVVQGGSQTFAIAADAGFEVADVLIDGQSVGVLANYEFSNVQADRSIEAVFSPVPTFTIVAGAGQGGSISPAGNVLVNQGSNQIFSIDPDSGFEIADVIVNGVSVGTQPTYEFVSVSSGGTIQAEFSALPSYTITATAGSGGVISPSGAVQVTEGSSQSFAITPDSGKVIDQVLVDGQVVVLTSNNFTFSDVVANGTISVSFKDAPVAPSNLFIRDATDDSVLYNLFDGMVIPKQEIGNTPIGITYDTPEVVVVSFNLSGPVNQIKTEGPLKPVSLFGDIGVDVQGVPFPAGDYTLVVSVQGGNTSTYNFTITDGPLTTFEILASAESGGSISPTGTVVVNEGSNQTFDIIPDVGFAVEDVLVNGQSVGNQQTYTFSNVSEDATVAASFTPVPTFILTATAGTGGSISPFGLVEVSQGQGQTFTITASPGFVVADVLVNGQSIGAVGSYTFANVDADGSISVSFEESQQLQPVIQFNYIDAVNDVAVDEITEGGTINGALYAGQGYNIQAVANPQVAVGSVKLELTGAANITRTESAAPFALFGDSAGDYFEGNIPLGQYTIKATAFSGAGLTGTVLGVLETNFEVDFTTTALKVSLAKEDRVYPNPATDFTRVHVVEPANWLRFELYNSAGVLVRSLPMSEVNPDLEQEVTLPVYGLQYGIYSILMQGADGRVQKLRLVIAE